MAGDVMVANARPIGEDINPGIGRAIQQIQEGDDPRNVAPDFGGVAESWNSAAVEAREELAERGRNVVSRVESVVGGLVGDEPTDPNGVGAIAQALNNLGGRTQGGWFDP